MARLETGQRLRRLVEGINAKACTFQADFQNRSYVMLVVNQQNPQLACGVQSCRLDVLIAEAVYKIARGKCYSRNQVSEKSCQTLLFAASPYTRSWAAGVDAEILKCKCTVCNHDDRKQCLLLDCQCCNLEDQYSMLTNVEATEWL
jgi:hypothetical protein